MEWIIFSIPAILTGHRELTTVNFLFKFSNLLEAGLIYNWPSPIVLRKSSTDKSYDIRTRFHEHYLMSDHYQPPKIHLNGDLRWNSAAFLIYWYWYSWGLKGPFKVRYWSTYKWSWLIPYISSRIRWRDLIKG